MAKPQIITALDLGSSTIKLLSALKQPDTSDLQVLLQTEIPCAGIRKGVVIEPRLVAQKISELLQNTKNQFPQQINSIFVNVGGSHLFATPAHGEIAVSRADQKISAEDIERVLTAAQTFSLPLNKEIVDVFPKEFIVDGERGIKEPCGLKAVKLETEILAICAFSPYLKNLTEAVLGADLQINDLVPSSLASARAVLSQKEKELGVAILDIGAGTSDLAIFEEQTLLHLATFPIGSSLITNDIAIGLKIDIELADRLKKEFGACVLQKQKGKPLTCPQVRGKQKIHKIELNDFQSPLTFSQKALMNIITIRVSEIFEQVEKELKKISRHRLLPAGLVLCGGGAKMPGIIELAKKKLALPVKIIKSFPGFHGLDGNPCFATAAGLILHGLDIRNEQQIFLWKDKLFNKIKKIFRIFVP